jgi:branched-chain amino acid transport system permease protein
MIGDLPLARRPAGACCRPSTAIHDTPADRLVDQEASFLAGLAGVIAGNYLTTESAMADAMGPIVFVVVIFGGLGSLAGCFIASILMGMVQTFSVVFDYSFADVLKPFGVTLADNDLLGEILTIPMSRIGPLIPYALLILILVFRPRGLMGTRET